jgi:hypothetical protein
MGCESMKCIKCQNEINVENIEIDGCICVDCADNGCEHENGWVINEPIAVSPDEHEEHIAECKCNNIGCNEKRMFKFDIINVRKIDDHDTMV